MSTKTETPENVVSTEALEMAYALIGAVRDALEPHAETIDEMWQSAKEELTQGEYSGAMEDYRQYLLGDIQQSVRAALTGAEAPLMVDNSYRDQFFTIFHKRHNGVPVGSRIGCFGGAEVGDFDAILTNLEVTIEETCLDFKNTYA